MGNEPALPDVRSYFQSRLVDADVVAVERFPRGLSRETWFVELRCAGQPRKLVLRRDRPGNSIDPRPLSHEFALYEALGRTNIPVPRALWWEDGPNSLGDRPF